MTGIKVQVRAASEGGFAALLLLAAVDGAAPAAVPVSAGRGRSAAGLADIAGRSERGEGAAPAVATLAGLPRAAHLPAYAATARVRVEVPAATDGAAGLAGGADLKISAVVAGAVSLDAELQGGAGRPAATAVLRIPENLLALLHASAVAAEPALVADFVAAVALTAVTRLARVAGDVAAAAVVHVVFGIDADVVAAELAHFAVDRAAGGTALGQGGLGQAES